MKVKLPVGTSATVTYTATVKDTAPEYLADAAADDKTNAGDGYRNTATASDVKATATMSDGTPVTYDKDTYPKDTEGKTPLDDKHDMANTPVKLTPSYTMEQSRATEAPVKGNTGKYGFRYGDTVMYTITVVNTGETVLTMDVSDSFADSTYFTDLTYTTVTGTDVTWNNNTSGAATTTAPNITIGCNGTHDNKAVITVTAVVASVTPESLSNAAADDGKGYENTAETTNVVSKATESDGTKTTTAITSPLEGRRDTAHTPVQLTAVTPGNGGGGGGNTPTTSVKPTNLPDKGTPGTHTVTNGGYADGTDLYGFNPDGTPMGNIWTAGGNLPKTGEAWRNLALLGAVSLLMLFLFLILIRRKRQADNMEHPSDPYKSKSK